MKKAPQIVIQNNTASIIPVSLFNTLAAGSAGSSNGRIVYSWNLASQSYVEINTISIQVKTNAAANYTTYQVQGSFRNITDVLTALNSLGVGQFFINTLAGPFVISVPNDFNIYNNLSISSTIGFTVTWQINLLVPVLPPVSFSILDLTLGGTVLYSGADNELTGSVFFTAPDAVIGHQYLFQGGWPSDGFHASTNTLYLNGVAIQETIMFDLFGGCTNILAAYGVTYNLIVDVTA